MKFLFGCMLVCALFIATAVARPQQRPQPNWNDFFAPTPRPLQQPDRPGFTQNVFFPTPAPIFEFDDGISVSTSTTAAPSTSTTASPQYLACMQRCPTTSQYNPVCGNDAVDYHNQARLDCAVFCGRNVAAVRIGTCEPL